MKSRFIRPAKPAEAGVLTDIAFAAKRHWGYPESWIQEWSGQLTITPEFVRNHIVLVMCGDAEVLGVAAIGLAATEANLLHLWIKPSVMNEGIGTALFKACETAARGGGARRMVIESDPHAEAFYRKMGANPIGHVAASIQGVERYLPRLLKYLV